MKRKIGWILCRFLRLHRPRIVPGATVDFSRTDRPRYSWRSCACGMRQTRTSPVRTDPPPELSPVGR